MAIILSNLHLQRVAERLANTTNDDVRFSLYTNDVSPSAASVISDFTREATAILYDEVIGRPYASGGWQVQDYQAIVRNVVGWAGGKTVYGFVIFGEDNLGNAKLIHAHRFTSPVVIPADTTKAISVEIRSKARQV